MIGDTIISDNEREIGIVQVFTPEAGFQGWARELCNGDGTDEYYFPAGRFGYITRLAPITEEDLVRWSLIRPGGPSVEDFLYDASFSEDEYFTGYGFMTPEEALEAGTKILRAFSRWEWYFIIYESIHQEEDIIYLDMLKIFEFEAWSETVACNYRPFYYEFPHPKT